MIKHFIKQSWLLIISSLFFGLLIAVTNASLAPRIEQNKKDKINNLMGKMVIGATDFSIIADVNIPGKKGKMVKTQVYQGKNEKGQVLGYAFIASGPGFADKIELVIAADSSFEKFLGYDVLSSNETPGFGDKITQDFYRGQFIGAPLGQLELIKSGKDQPTQVVAITGATISSEAVISIFNMYGENIKKQLQAKGLINNE
jgi:electron transport complex protein RnfG